MKKGILFFLLFIIFFNAQAQKSNRLLAGASSAPVNPPVNSFIAGDKQNRRFAGVHDDLFAKAVVITNNNNSVALLTVDCIGLLYPQLMQIRKEVKKALPEFPVNQIILSSTHTHSGPDVVGVWGPDLMHSGVDSSYIRMLVNIAAQQIVNAYRNRLPVQATYAITTYGEDWVENISQPGETDRSVTILQLENKKKKNIATLTNFACHPTFLDGINDKVSADYVAGYYELLNKKQGGVNMFLQGSIGGWVQPEHEPRTFEAAAKRGGGLAEAVLIALKNKKEIQGDELIFRSKQLNIPLTNPGFKQLSAMGVIKREFTDSVLTEIAWFSVGNAVFATHPGETVPAMSLATKTMMQTNGPKFILGLSMDALGYILKPEFFDAEKKIPHSEYLCSMSVGIETMAFIIKALGSLSKNE